jgi:hypothetical protein
MKIVIQNKETKLELDKDQIVEVLETADGIAFNMRNNLSLIFTDNFMPSEAKQLIKGTIDQTRTVDATIQVNLQDRVRPVSIDVNSVAAPDRGE